MGEDITYVGMDAHKRTIAVSVRSPGGGFDERTQLADITELSCARRAAILYLAESAR